MTVATVHCSRGERARRRVHHSRRPAREAPLALLMWWRPLWVLLRFEALLLGPEDDEALSAFVAEAVSGEPMELTCLPCGRSCGSWRPNRLAMLLPPIDGPYFGPLFVPELPELSRQREPRGGIKPEIAALSPSERADRGARAVVKLLKEATNPCPP